MIDRAHHGPETAVGSARRRSTREPDRAKLPGVIGPEAEFVGREPELAALREALARARLGRGSIWLVQGEPGIGKSRLCQRVSRLASDLGLTTVWGRAWEAGGAPAYWPWLQALRQLLREHEQAHAAFAQHVAELAAVMPELSERFGAIAAPPALEPEQARFQLLHAVTETLAQSSEQVPLLVVLEDLHAADSSSVGLLEFLSKLVQSMHVVVIGTLRDADAMWSPVAPALLRVQREARVLTLPRLSKDEVDAFLSAALDRKATDVLDAVYRVTEGHPLFIVETARLMVARGDVPAGAPGIPATVKIAIRERLTKLSAGALELLRAASVFGREVSLAPLAALLETEPDHLEEPLREATERAMLVDAGTGAFRFSHVLFQEVLLHEIEPAERQRLHLAVARILERTVDGAPSSVLAHHYLRAGAAGRNAAIDAAVAAAAEATRQLAFDDAVDWCRAALDALEQGGEPDPRRRCRLLLGLGRARFAAGQIEAAEQTARLAGEAARAACDAELVAEAALARAAAIVFAEVDPERIAFLRAALDGLPEGDSGLRAQLMARLAAAMQPAADPRGPIELARRAVDMARRVGDETTLLATMRSAGSALTDLAPPADRMELNREHIRLAQTLNEPVEALRGTSRLVFDHVQTGELAAARATIDAAQQIAGRLGHPHYKWMPALLEAMMAAATGDFARWEQQVAEARRYVQASGDPNGPRTLLVHQIGVLALRGRYEAALALSPDLAETFTGSSIFEDFAAPIVRMLELRAKRPASRDDSELERQLQRVVLQHGDAALLPEAAALCVATNNRALARSMYDAFVHAPFALVHGGFFEMVIKGPIGLPLGTLARLLGRPGEAERHFSGALELADRTGAEPFAGWAELELAELGLATGASRPVVLGRLDRARRIAERLDLPDLLQRADAARAGLAEDESEPGPATARGASEPSPNGPGALLAGVPAPGGFSLEREGDLWRVRSGGGSFLVKDMRGMHMLHRLVTEPGRSFHALDLVSTPGEVQDSGDAGAMLDEQARAEYERRLGELREELDEAEAFGDIGRAARTREELDFLARELGRAVGIGGRARRTGSSAERARVNAQRRLRDAIRRIGEHDPALARHLQWAVKTGTFCCYSVG